jgi:catechol 2,3-dioxygenase-like lactoylglutathione lyase family enzyme
MEKTEAKTVRALKAHLAINVKDVEQSIGFYKKLFGIEPSKVRKGYAKFNVENPPLNFTLNQVPFGERGALSHLGIQVGSTEDVLAVRERWQASGLVPLDEMQTNCCYALQDKTWVRDPDGNEWEVFVVLEDNLPQAGGEGSCCMTNEGAKLDAGGAEVQAAGSCAASLTEAAATVGSCGCESAPPPSGQAPCCDTQAAKFNLSR